MRRIVGVCAGATVLALGVVIAPMAVTAGPPARAAALAAGSAGQFHSQPVQISAPRLVNLRAASHAAPSRHPDLVAPMLYYNPSAIAAGRAAAARSGGRRTGVHVLSASGSGTQASSATSQAWAGFPAMSLSRQISLFGADQALQPPDTQLAAGPGAVLEATNSSLSVWSKTGSLVMTADANVFFGVGAGFSFTDPRVLYDAESGRWFVSGFSFDTAFSSQDFLAVSATSDPTGNWYVYFVNYSPNVLTDQPMTGVCSDKVVISWNDFSEAGNFTQTQTLVLLKSDLVDAIAPVGQTFYNANEFRLVPAQSLSPSSTCWMTVNRSDLSLGGATNPGSLGVIAITGLPPTSVTLTETDLPLATPTVTPLPPEQPSAQTDDTSIDDRVLSAVWQNNVLWTSATDQCTPPGAHLTTDCLRLWEVNTSAATPSLVVDTDLAQAGADLYYPAVSLDTAGDLVVSYSASSSTLFPGAYAVMLPSGASPPAFTAPVTIAQGRASYNGGPDARWGDYSAAAPDPSVPGAMWVGGEYAPSNAGSGYWATGAALVSLTAPAQPAVALGVEGTDGRLWVQAPYLGSGWKPLGGKIIAAPAVAAAPTLYGSTPAQPLFIATGTNKRLFIRSLTIGWHVVGPDTGSCIGGPAAVITNGTLTLACRGLNNSLWTNSATLPSNGTLPLFTHGWKNLGGVISAAPAVAPVNGVITFFVRGTTGRIFTRTLTTRYRVTPWLCIGAPAAAAEVSSSDTIFACQGLNRALWEAVNGGAGWVPPVPLGGILIAGPAVAATSRVTDLLAEGTNHAVWLRTSSGWSTLGGKIVGGVGAAALN